MTESPLIIRMNISHYQAMLQLNMSAEKRSAIERLLTEAEAALVQPTATKCNDSGSAAWPNSASENMRKQPAPAGKNTT
jgi:hypothetical protein